MTLTKKIQNDLGMMPKQKSIIKRLPIYRESFFDKPSSLSEILFLEIKEPPVFQIDS